MTPVSKGPVHPLVRVLGPLSLTRRGADQPVTDRALRAICSMLVAHANRAVPAESLLDAAWEPHDRPRSPLDALDTRVTRLRTLLAPEADISWSTTGCVLVIDAARVDAVCFERMVEAARWCPAREAIATLRRALALWRGEALPDLRRDGREHPEALRLRQLRARAVEDLAARELEVGAVEDAAGRLLALLSAEPLRERACGYAMWALHRLDMTSDAVTCYDQLVERLADDLGEGPSTELRETYRAVTGTEPAQPPGERGADDLFVGRGHELARLSTMLDRDRLVTVTGPPGSGKSRLVAEALATTDVPATWVRLSTCDTGRLCPEVAAALGVHPWPGMGEGGGDGDDGAAALAEYLCGRRLLLVLDGGEHLLSHVRALVRRLRGRCRDVTIVVTGRVRLGLAGERVLPLGPLARDGTRDPLVSRAGRLFLDRARRVSAAFPRDEGEADTARAVLGAVPCLPLSVELLAARVAGAGGVTPSPARACASDVVEWAYDELPEAGRDLLGRLTVFGGEIDVSSAAAVADPGGDAGDALAELHRAGLLTAVTAECGARYRLPDAVHRLAHRRRGRTESTHKARQRHALWLVEQVTEAASLAARGDGLAGFARLCRMEDDLCAVLRWAVPEEPALAAELTGQLGMLTTYRPRARLLPWQLDIAREADPRLSRHALAAASGADAAVYCGLPEEGLRLAARAAELATTPPHRAAAVRTLVGAYYDLGDDDRATAACHELLGLADVPDLGVADAHAFLSLLATRGGRAGDALASAEVAARHARAASSACRLALASYAEGMARVPGEPADAAITLVRARREARAARAVWIAASAGTALAEVLLTLGRVPEAAKLLQLTLDDWHRMHAPRQLRACVDIALRCLASAGDRAGADELVRTQRERSPSEAVALTRTARAVAAALATHYGAARE
ncbi:AfsR/SARP family transcriptional regulator [Saccharomonospora piscinae]|uniref:AfsR/SARP family transcriptional regulator n=1 Tax=Saccharomonospora piscinae TaxID=687388 RepID=UPI00110634F9|nr:BTAD domain-containing putative transcriptional regulator [Saccharomonospora piscinae]TLW93481.1 AfsR/SARP family transcriptional regulator [Saccharomonospora piscinae]